MIFFTIHITVLEYRLTFLLRLKVFPWDFGISKNCFLKYQLSQALKSALLRISQWFTSHFISTTTCEFKCNILGGSDCTNQDHPSC